MPDRPPRSPSRPRWLQGPASGLLGLSLGGLLLGLISNPAGLSLSAESAEAASSGPFSGGAAAGRPLAAAGLGPAASAAAAPRAGQPTAAAPQAGAAPAAPAAPRPVDPAGGGLITIESDSQQADQSTGVITATGNVRILYPERRMVATARQAQYYAREGRLVLSGDVDVLDAEGQRIRAERLVYLLDGQRLQAEPAPGRQVVSRLRLQPRSGASGAPTLLP